MYKIDIWQYRVIVETFENKDIQEVLNWYLENWQLFYNYDDCAFSVYENNIEIGYDREYELGFH